jgi:integrase
VCGVLSFRSARAAGRCGSKIREVIIINRVKIITEAQADEVYRRLPERSKLIFALCHETGLRISDILWLRIRDIENPMNFPISRTHSVHTVKLPDWIYGQLLERVDRADGRQNDYIFKSAKNPGHIHRTTFHRDIKQATAELNFSCSAHSIRKLYFSM